MLRIDLNCDLGEGMENDALLMPWISSANIACGAHAGDETTMQRTVELAMKYKVAIGAHPGFNDKQNFGRTEMELSDQALFDLITTQVYNMQKVADRAGATVLHVKPHGALYNMAARDQLMARKICKAIKAVDPGLMLYGLSGSYLITTAAEVMLSHCSEVFADRTYQDDGSLTPRSNAHALITDESDAIAQVMQMIKEKKITSVSGREVTIKAETVCLHGDGVQAVQFAKKIHAALKEQHVNIINPHS